MIVQLWLFWLSPSPTTGASAPTVPEVGLGVSHQLYIQLFYNCDR